MLWYLLYPIRGTAQPPRLSANHPIRRAFYRHGKTTAQHWLVAMLVSVAIAMGFSYPTILLSENPTAGLASHPHHVWTTAKPLDNQTGYVTDDLADDPADVEMRQVWIHGSYMRALDKDVLRSALKIQQSLVGGEPLTDMFPSLDEKLRDSTLSWGFHSPLMYWNNSQAMIDSDDDILRTVNDQARNGLSPLNLALRPASVFAGKKFDQRRLTAADALVITLMNKVSGGVGSHWRNQMGSLATGACKDCMLFPRDGYVTRNRVYEFSFTPLSMRENVALSLAYGCMAIYVLLSLSRMKAFHSRFGLVVTAITQMTCSILASFTICGILKINLSMIPQNAYPFVVLVMGIENMFRIINAVLAYPATMATDLRIANALGDVGPVSVATAVQNVAILSLLARLVSPGVAAFCAFACIATLFDAFFLLTFFVAVLMVDIRRFELQDALARANHQAKHKRRPSPMHHNTWFDALVHGRLPFSTRMAGTAVTTTFILSLNYHFFEHKEKTTSLRDVLRLIKNGPPTLDEFDTFAPPPINASLTPGQWMRMQDFDTAREAMRLAKPGADSFVIRVFAPLIVVLGGANRSDVLDEDNAWTTALRSFAIHHFYPVAVAVVFIVTFVAVLMNFLLYSEQEVDSGLDSDGGQEESNLKVKTVALPHRLDIVKLSATKSGHFVTVALDRTIAIGIYDRSHQSHRIQCPTMEQMSAMSWPVHNAALDENGQWMACHCSDGFILVYSVAAGKLFDAALLYPDDNPPLLFMFTRLSSAEGSQLHFVLLTSGGRILMANIETGVMRMIRLAELRLVGASITEHSSQGRHLVVVTDEAKVLAYAWNNDEWLHTISQSLPTSQLQVRTTGAVKLEPLSELGTELLLVTLHQQVIFLDGQSLAVIGTLDVVDGQPPIDFVMLGQSMKCPVCGHIAFRSITLVTEAAGNRACVVARVEAAGGNDTPICLRGNTDGCQSFDKTQTITQDLERPGAWSVVASQAVLGYRRREHQSNGNVIGGGDKRLRRRKQSSRSYTKAADNETERDTWEAYKLSADGELDTVDASRSRDAEEIEGPGTLYGSQPGPTVPLDGQSIAVAFGNTVKIIRSARRGSKVRRVTGRSFERQIAGSKESKSR